MPNNQERSVTANAVTLISGTGAAQLVALLALPLLTRLYTPEEFGLFAVFSAILSVGATIVCLRYELAIVLPKTNRAALLVFRLCLLATLFVSALAGISFFFTYDTLKALYGQSAPNWLVLIPLSMFVGGMYKAATFWHTRLKNYKRLAYSKVSQSVPQTLIQLLLGFTPLGLGGLVIGEIFGKLCGTATLWLNNSGLIIFDRSTTPQRLKKVANTYRSFPLVSSWSVVVNQLGAVAPALVIASYFGVEMAGWYAMAQRVLAVPMDLVGQAILSLYVGEASQIIRENPSQTKFLYWKFLRKMFLLGAVPVIVVLAAGDWLFLNILGNDWATAAIYAKILVFGFWFRFAISPLSQTLNMIGRQDIQLYWDLSRLFLVIGCFSLVVAYDFTTTSALTIYTGIVILSQAAHAALTHYQLKGMSS